MRAHAYAAVHDGSAIFPRIFLTSRSLLSEDVATRQLPNRTGPLSSSLDPASAIEERLTPSRVTSVREEAAAKKRGHYHHHFGASVRAAMGKYASENGNSAAARHFSQLVGVFEIIIAEICAHTKIHAGLIVNFSRRKFPAIR